MRKRYWLFLVLISVLVASLLLPACAAPKEVTLKFAYSPAPGKSIGIAYDWFAEEVTKRTEGMVKVDAYPGETLYKQAATVDSVIARVADIGEMSLGVHMERVPIIQVAGLPTLGFPDTLEGNLASSDAAMALYEKFPEIEAEFEYVKMLGIQQLLNYNIWSKKEIRVPGDLKGLKLGGTGARANLAEVLGATSVHIPPPDAYMNLKTGVVDAVFVSWSQAWVYKMWEVGEYVCDFGFGCTALTMIMNWDAWKALPSKYQKIIIDVEREKRAKTVGIFMESVDSSRKATQEAGRPVIVPTAAEAELWQKAAQPVFAAWLAKAKASGAKDPQKILDEWNRLVAEARK